MSLSEKTQNFLNIIPIFLGLLTVLLGVSVSVGWFVKSYTLIQVFHAYPPMQFNTALCFIFSGLCLYFFYNKSIKLSSFFCILVLSISAITLAEYIFNLNVGIDELFIKSYISTANSYPGRMAPNTALAFISFSLAILINILDKNQRLNIVSIILSYFVLSLALIGLLGFILSNTLSYGLGQWIKMAFHSAFGLVFLSTGAILILSKKKYALLIPISFSFICLITTFIFWQSVKAQEENQLYTILNNKIDNIASSLRINIDERLNSFSRISYRWLNRDGGTPKSEWELDVNHYVLDQPGYIAIEYVNKNFEIEWVAPYLQNKKIIGYNLFQDAVRRHEVELALKEKKIKMSPIVDLIQGGRGILIFSPLIKEKDFYGFMVGAINTQVFLDSVLKNTGYSDVKIDIDDQNGHLYVNELKDFMDKIVVKRKINIYDQVWELSVKPSSTLFESYNSLIISWIIIIVGSTVSILSGMLISSFLSIKKLERKAKNVNERLTGIIEGSSDYIAAIDLNYNFLVFNKSYQSEIYRLFKIKLKVGSNYSELAQKMNSETKNKILSLWEKALKGSSFVVTECFKDNHEDVHYETHYNPIFDENGKLMGASSTASNISSRIKYENEILSYRRILEEKNDYLKYQNSILETLKEMSSILQLCTNEPEVIETIQKFIVVLLKDTSGGLFLFSEEKPTNAELALKWGDYEPTDTHIDINDCFAFFKQQTYLVEDPASKVNCKHVEKMQNFPVNYLCVPLLVKNKVLGLLYIEHNTNNKGKINKLLINCAQAIAEKLSLNLQNLKLQNSLKVASIHDSLTNLYNRRFFEEYVESEIAKSKRYNTFFGLILLDIDHFKNINDKHGHLVGDNVLRSLAGFLKKEVRKSDIVCRWGGEEFILFLPEISLEDIKIKAEALRESIEKIAILEGNLQIKFTVSIGVSVFDSESDLNALIKKADDALYQAKNSGRNQVVVTNHKQLN